MCPMHKAAAAQTARLTRHTFPKHTLLHTFRKCALFAKSAPLHALLSWTTHRTGACRIATGIAITSQCSAPVKPARPPRLPTGAPPVRTACRRERAARVPQLSQLRIQLLVVAFPVLSIVDPMHSDLAGGPAARTVEEPADLVRVRGHLPSEPGSPNLAPCSMD